MRAQGSFSIRLARSILSTLAWLAPAALLSPPGLHGAPAGVRLLEEKQTIPTYRVAAPDLNPRFYSGRTYQGARATFYPYPVSDKLTDVREDRTYETLMLENSYVRFSVLPELGGRIFTAEDKSNGYDFFYRQHVIKPALIGMLGAWISGGVEWNVPHHHRASSFMPVDYSTRANADGSRTIWVGETEWRHRMKWAVGLTLHPDRSYIEMTVKLFNRTPLPHSFLFWINPAVHANPRYQVIFPPSTEFAVQHGKPEFVHWPIARTTYAGVDYSSGVDISWWQNHPSPCSFFAWDSGEDFFGGYDHGRQAGVLHVANHHVVPGKKFFEWGVGPDGEMWSEILTDADGPYLELMAGAYSDNQPDYSWCQPDEVKTWTHYWYPVRNLGGVKNATVDGALNLVVSNATIRCAVNTTAVFDKARVVLTAGNRGVFATNATISPSQPFSVAVALPEGVREDDLTASVHSTDGRELVSYKPKPKAGSPMPRPVQRPRPPKEIQSNEELYLTGLRIEQLYSPSFEAAPYYEEAIRRDPGDYRANTALGILLCKALRHEEAEKKLNAAIQRTTENYIRPKDAEACYYLGVALAGQQRYDEAYDAYYRAVWSQAWQAAGYRALAEIDCRRGLHAQALALVDRSLAAGAMNLQARQLKVSLLRKQRRFDEARQLNQSNAELAPLSPRVAFEGYLAARAAGSTNQARAVFAELSRFLQGKAQSWLELAAEYAEAGLYGDAMEVLQAQIESTADKAKVLPLTHYWMGYCLDQSGHPAEALRFYRLAAEMSSDYCFPFRAEEEKVLRQAMSRNPDDPRAAYYLGNLLFDHQPQKAIEAWEKSRQMDGAFALTHRNLGLAYAQAQGDISKAIASLEKAVNAKPKEPRFLYELDVLYEAGGESVSKRIEVLDRHRDVLEERDDIYTRWIVLLTAAGEADRAVGLVTKRRFHNWEGRGEVHGHYVNALVERGLAHSRAGRHEEALKDYVAALEYPRNLEVGRPYRDRRAAQVHYLLSTALEALDRKEEAGKALQDAVAQRERGASEVQYFQGLALVKLQRVEEAKQVFDGLVRQGQGDLKAADEADYFAKFGERQSERARKAQAHYLIGLGYLGQERSADAKAELELALKENPAHVGANREVRHAGR